jgi:hypothetical protein
MELRLFQQIVALNQSFDQLIAGLMDLESVPFFQRHLLCHARSDVEIARVYANREFFDNFERIVEDDAKWAYRFQRNFNEKLKDRNDIYLELREAEQRRKRKGSRGAPFLTSSFPVTNTEECKGRLWSGSSTSSKRTSCT